MIIHFDRCEIVAMIIFLDDSMPDCKEDYGDDDYLIEDVLKRLKNLIKQPIVNDETN